MFWARYWSKNPHKTIRLNMGLLDMVGAKNKPLDLKKYQEHATYF